MKNSLAATAARAALVAVTLLVAPLAASAQDVPSYAAQNDGDAQIRGRVENFDGGYNLQVRDDRGFVDNVQLHDGTIINPTGLTIAPGMVVSVVGYNSGSYFSANEVDTPYTYDAGVPYYDGHPWGYYGPTIDLSFFFGNTGWWHGSDFGRGYGFDRGVRVYDDVHVRNVYHNDTYRSNNAGLRQRPNAVAPGNAYRGRPERTPVSVPAGRSGQSHGDGGERRR